MCHEGPAGHFPPVLHKAPVSDEPHRSGRQFSRAHNPEAIARAKGAGTGASTGGKSNLAGQIIPIYGFAILLYILYLLFKVRHHASLSYGCHSLVCLPEVFFKDHVQRENN